MVNAQYWYGRMLVEGRGVEANPEEGRVWITRAADVGMIEAQVMLADMMLTGRGGPKDHPAALALFQKAAGQGHVGAMFAVGAMHGGGHEVPWDRVAAQRWFRAAAERGHPYAQMMLGRYLARNLAGEQDIEEARRWIERAVAQGLQEAKADLAALPPAPEPDGPRPRRNVRPAGGWRLIQGAAMPTAEAEPAVVALARSAMHAASPRSPRDDMAAALRWLDRAHRLVPQDPNVALTLASAASAPIRAGPPLCSRSVAEARRPAGLARPRRCPSAPGRTGRGRRTAGRRACPATPSCRTPRRLPNRSPAPAPDGAACGRTAGWRSMPHTIRGPIRSGNAGRQPLCAATHDCPPAGQRGQSIEVRRAGPHLLGSPIQIDAIRRLAGCVEVCEGGMRGWAWHPGDPRHPPVLTLTYAGGLQQTSSPTTKRRGARHRPARPAARLSPDAG